MRAVYSWILSNINLDSIQLWALEQYLSVRSFVVDYLPLLSIAYLSKIMNNTVIKLDGCTIDVMDYRLIPFYLCYELTYENYFIYADITGFELPQTHTLVINRESYQITFDNDIIFSRDGTAIITTRKTTLSGIIECLRAE